MCKRNKDVASRCVRIPRGDQQHSTHAKRVNRCVAWSWKQENRFDSHHFHSSEASKIGRHRTKWPIQPEFIPISIVPPPSLTYGVSPWQDYPQHFIKLKIYQYPYIPLNRQRHYEIRVFCLRIQHGDQPGLDPGSLAQESSPATNYYGKCLKIL